MMMIKIFLLFSLSLEEFVISAVVAAADIIRANLVFGVGTGS